MDRLNSKSVMDAVAEVYEVPVQVLRGRSKRREVVDARWVVYHLLIDELRMSASRVASLLNRDRTLYAYALRQHRALYATELAYRRKVDGVRALLGLEVGGGVK